MLLLLRVFVLFRSHSKISVFLFYQFLGLFDLISFRRKTNKRLGERERERWSAHAMGGGQCWYIV
jgi:hypothetical protein